MWEKIITAILPVAMKLIVGAIEKGAENKKAREAFQKFLREMMNRPSVPVNLRNEYEDMKRRLTS